MTTSLLNNDIAILKSHLKSQGARILGELNDFKRTVKACAEDINWPVEDVQAVIDGIAPTEKVMALIEAISQHYPINASDLTLHPDDCESGVRIMRGKESEKTARVFERRTKDGGLSPYYEYRDTAMSRHAAFRPEWIEELRVVADNAPDNPNVIYNNGHFMHQVTFFVGPVNFYYEVDGVKKCAVMNTGDSNYITPFHPHSFASRDKNQLAYIVAVTFGGDVKRSLDELYRLGRERAHNFRVDLKQTKNGTQQLIDYHLKNENLSRTLLQTRLDKISNSINVMDQNQTYNDAQLAAIANALSIEISDLQLPPWRDEEAVVVAQPTQTDAYAYPSSEQPAYQLTAGARCRRVPQVKAFNIQPLKTEPQLTEADALHNSLHTYLYNYGDAPVKLCWTFENAPHLEILQPDDSAYIQPFIAYRFAKVDAHNNPAIFSVGIPGTVNAVTQRELSAFADFNRVVGEDRCWFST